MSYIYHHTELCLQHQLNPADIEGAFLDFSPDAELGVTPIPLKRQVGSGWRFPHLAVRESGLSALGLKKQATPVVQQPIQKLGA